MPTVAFLLYLLYLIEVANAVAVQNPLITPAPSIAARQAGNQFCGFYANGDANSPIGCTGSSTCVTSGTIVGCADDFTTFVPQYCWHYGLYTTDCGPDKNVLCCSDYEYPSCATFRLSISVGDVHALYALACYAGTTATTIHALATPIVTGSGSVSTLAAVGALIRIAGAAAPTASPGSSASATAQTSTSTTHTYQASTSASNLVTSGTATSTSSATSPTSTTSGSQGSWSTGKIAGVSIGTIATIVVAVLGLAKAYIEWRKNKVTASSYQRPGQQVENNVQNDSHNTHHTHANQSQHIHLHGWSHGHGAMVQALPPAYHDEEPELARRGRL